MRATNLALGAVMLALVGCGSTSTPADTGPSSSDAGHDAALVATDSGTDAASATDTGPTMCSDTYGGCTTIEDHTADTMVTIGVVMPSATQYAYTPRCIRIHTGTMVTITNSALHPLFAATCSTPGGPLPTAASTTTSFTFTSAGHYGYYCANHGADDGTGMAGLIIVQ